MAVLMVSAPSTVTRLLRSRMPPKEMRVTSVSVIVDCRLVRPKGDTRCQQREIGEEPAADRQRVDLLGVDHLADFRARGLDGRRFPW